MSVAYVLIAIAALSLLMIVHEGGHYLAARRFKMRVTRFSIGFGPTILKHQPRGSSTVFQVAIIPFIAYVQIAGMNPYEDGDPHDPESYANASLWGRIVTIASGPLANYFFASVLIFSGLLIGGREEAIKGTQLQVIPGGPAALGGLEDGDRVVAVAGEHVETWDDLRRTVGARAGKETDMLVERRGESVHKLVTPQGTGENGGRIMVQPTMHNVPVGFGEALKLGLIEPPDVVYSTVVGIARVITGKEKAEVSGPWGMAKVTAGQAAKGPGRLLQWLGALSAYLGAFNLLPIPALDGGRLIFLFAEAVSRRKLNAKIEQGVHAVGLLMLLTLLAVVTVFDVTKR